MWAVCVSASVHFVRDICWLLADHGYPSVVSCIGWGTASVPNEWSWRSITLLQVVPSAIQLSFIWWIPESPRFLVNKDRHEEALNVLAKWHAGGDFNNATVRFEFLEIKETIRMEKEAHRSTSYLDFFRTKGNRWRLAIVISLGIISQYSGNAIFSNYINAIYDGAGIHDENKKLALSTGKNDPRLDSHVISSPER